ncbi:hypothetical protein C6P78_07145 [Burkholderia multivorans]|nr:hypothetical protein C6P78_07145 [Burkholderia multivorans]
MAWLGRRGPSGLRRSAGAGRGRPDWPEAARASRTGCRECRPLCRNRRAGLSVRAYRTARRGGDRLSSRDCAAKSR